MCAKMLTGLRGSCYDAYMHSSNMYRKGNLPLPRIIIRRNDGPKRIGRNCFHEKRWGHATLPQYNGRIATRRRLHLLWLGPIFVITIPRGN